MADSNSQPLTRRVHDGGPHDEGGRLAVVTLTYTTVSGGIPEPLAAAAGFALVAVATDVFPFAVGTMMAVIFREMIPSSHGHGYADLATLAFVSGFGVMLVVDVALAV